MVFDIDVAFPIQNNAEVEFLHYLWFSIENKTQPMRIVEVGTEGPMLSNAVYDINYSIYQHGWENQMKIVDEISYPEGITTFQNILARVASDNPDAIIVEISPPDRTTFETQLAAVPQLKGVIVVSDAWDDDPSYWGTVGQYGAYGFVVGPAFSLYSNVNNAAVAAKWDTFRAEFKALSGTLPGDIGACGYDLVWVSAFALEQAGSTNNMAVINALNNLKLTPTLENILMLLHTSTPTGTVFYNSTSAGPLWHCDTLQPLGIEGFWNSTSNSIYTEVVWPPQYATTSPVPPPS